MSLILELRDGKIILPEEYFKRYLNVDWFLSSLYNFPNETPDEKTKIFTLWESKDAVLTLIDSLKFQKLTLHNNISLDYLNNLAEMWCAPDWLKTEIKNKLEESQKLIINPIDDELNNYIFVCSNCKIGFKLKDNKENSCKFHPRYYVMSENKFICCGRTPNEEPCRSCFHIPEKYLEIRESLKKLKL